MNQYLLPSICLLGLTCFVARHSCGISDCDMQYAAAMKTGHLENTMQKSRAGEMGNHSRDAGTEVGFVGHNSSGLTPSAAANRDTVRRCGLALRLRRFDTAGCVIFAS